VAKKWYVATLFQHLISLVQFPLLIIIITMLRRGAGRRGTALAGAA
jgi:hypothetical protein